MSRTRPRRTATWLLVRPSRVLLTAVACRIAVRGAQRGERVSVMRGGFKHHHLLAEARRQLS
ncbi:hypothetical protein [Streptomyces sp. BR123]|uniref:hypothetical protein n=1 Tax=Streptomyces sp. BR123 TaxID=2749828 RepID=UPI00211B696C|nr:hypothetical protein [Streptomyces sp. BR123]